MTLRTRMSRDDVYYSIPRRVGTTGNSRVESVGKDERTGRLNLSLLERGCITDGRNAFTLIGFVDEQRGRFLPCACGARCALTDGVASNPSELLLHLRASRERRKQVLAIRMRLD
jgi:hypothetical protein